MLEGFSIIGKIEQIEIIAVGGSIRILPYLNKRFGKGRWRKLKGVATLERISKVVCVWRKFIGTRLTESENVTERSSDGSIKNMNTKFAVCINNKGFEASLEVGKLYEVVPDAEAESDKMIRVIDEDGEDYLFESSVFYPLVVPNDLALALHQRI